MHYLVTFYKPTSPDKLLTQAVRPKTRERWKKLVEANGYVVKSDEKVVESKRRGK